MDKRVDGHKSQVTVIHHTDPPSWRFQWYKFRGKSGTGFLIPRRRPPEKLENSWSYEEDLNQPVKINDTREARYSKVPITFRARKAVLCLILKMIQWKYISQRSKIDWQVYELGDVLTFNRFLFQNLLLDPKSYRAFVRESFSVLT